MVLEVMLNEVMLGGPDGAENKAKYLYTEPKVMYLKIIYMYTHQYSGTPL